MPDLSPLYAAAAAFLVTWLLLPAAIGGLRRAGLTQVVRQQGPASHLAKAGTPTAGGAVFVPVACLAAWAVDPRSVVLLACCGVTLGHAALGFADDYLKIVRKRPEGLWARHKLAGQLLLAGLLCLVALGARPEAMGLAVPWMRAHLVVAPLVFVALVVVALLGSTNGANFTDGADGLLGSTGAVALGSVGIVAWAVGDPGLAGLDLALCGALLAFLRWNWHPAAVFMGDTGSMAIGAAFASVGILAGLTLYLPLIGLFFLLEVLSVVLQVAWYRRTGKRLLRMAPLNHHLELSGWGEGRLVPRVLVFSLLCGAAGLLGYWWR